MMVFAQTSAAIPDIGPLGSVAGWAVAVFAVLGILGFLARAFLKGDIVPGSVAKAQAKELETLRALVNDDVVPPVKEIGKGVATLVVGMGFLTDFVKDVARGEGGGREPRDQPRR